MNDEIRHEKPVEVNLQLTHREAQALAQLVKRQGFSDCRRLATSDIEAYLMMDGINQLMKALAEEVMHHGRMVVRRQNPSIIESCTA
ncbi:DUF7706 family protein [Enterobacter hormaechei]|uniref:DUF7706 family protein n=1 Tax=Enterobacter hormaechei TaxID=158836 RepID=UPI003314563C